MIICHICKKAKPHSQYAKRQIQKFKDTIHNPYAPAGRCLTDPKTTCKTCTPQQVTELTCCVCSKTKGLTYFAKNQRKNPDIARCIKCVRMHLDAEPDVDPVDSDEYSESEDDGEGDFDDPDDDDGTQATTKRSKGQKVRKALVIKSTPDAMFPDENVPVPSAQGVTYLHPSIDPEHEWEIVSSAGRMPRAPMHLPSVGTDTIRGSVHGGAAGSAYGSSSWGGSGVKDTGWAKVEKVPKGQETKWGHHTETDEWSAYARNLTNRRDAIKKQQKKPKGVDSDDDDDDEDYFD